MDWLSVILLLATVTNPVPGALLTLDRDDAQREARGLGPGDVICWSGKVAMKVGLIAFHYPHHDHRDEMISPGPPRLW